MKLDTASDYKARKTAAVLISTHATRVFGLIVFMYGLSLGILPSLFAYSAGVGDFIVAATAIPVAYSLVKRYRFSKQLAVIWTGAGLLDFALAFAFAFATDATTMRTFPWLVIPTVVVPAYTVIHGIVLYYLIRKIS